MAKRNRGVVSVIIPCFNCEDHIAKTVQSCLAQGELLREVIVVDDDSTDNSLKVLGLIAKEEPKLKVIRNKKKGANNARNLGFEASDGEFIQWLDADDLLLPGKFESQVNALETAEADIAYSDFRLDKYDGERLIKSERINFESVEDYLFELIKDNWNASQSYLVRSNVAKRLSGGVGWNPKTLVGQDREYFTMAGILGARFQYVPGVYAVYNNQLYGTISGLEFKKRLELNQVLERQFGDMIRASKWISTGKKRAYLKVLNTHKVKACFYHSRISFDNDISLSEIDWHLIHWKMRLPILYKFIVQKLLYLISK
jgi:glycosyltransferase involved in cell wall biosynthesis